MKWLSWLARKMQSTAQISFRIEELHPNWLKAGWQRWCYQSIGLINKLIGTTLYCVSIALIYFGIILVLNFRGLTAKGIEIEKVILAHPLLSQLYSLSPALFIGICSGLALGLLFAMVVILSLLYDFLYALFNDDSVNDGCVATWGEVPTGELKLAITREKLKSPQYDVRFLLGVILVVTVSALILIGILSIWNIKLLEEISRYHLITRHLWLTFLPLVGCLIIATLLVKFIDIPKLEKSTYPNEGTWNAARKFITIFFLSLLANGLICGASIGLIRGLNDALVGGIVFGIAATIFIAELTWLDGAKVCIHHLTLRFILWRNGAMPWDYRKFLDYAADLQLVRKDGGAYVFYNPSLQEYLADMNSRRLTKLQ